MPTGYSGIRVRESAAIIIAAADSPHKERADYICTGTDILGTDQDIINLAFTRVDKVILMEGTFWISGSIELGGSQVLEGVGSSSVVKLRNSHNANLNMITNSDHVGGNSEVVVKDLSVDGNRSEQAGGDTYGIRYVGVTGGEVSTVYIGEIRHTGVYISGGEQSRMDGVSVAFCQEHGLEVSGSSGMVVSECLFAGGSTSAVELVNSDDSVVVACKFVSCPSVAIMLSHSDRCKIIGTVISGGASYGIYAYLGDYLVIVACVIDGTADDGLYTDGANYSSFIGNVIRASGNMGISLSGSSWSVISSNVVSDCGGNGIDVGSTSDSVISGNNVRGNSVLISNVRDDIIIRYNSHRNLISSNTCRAGVHANKPRYGINIDSGNDNVVDGNDVYDDGLVTATLRNNVANTIIRNNRGYNPVGISAIGVGGSPFTYTPGASPESVYISGGNVTSVVKGGGNMGVTTGTFELEPYEAIIVTYAAAPTMIKDVH